MENGGIPLINRGRSPEPILPDQPGNPGRPRPAKIATTGLPGFEV